MQTFFLHLDKTFMRGSSLGADLTRPNPHYLKVTRSSTISGRIQVKIIFLKILIFFFNESFDLILQKKFFMSS